MLINGTEVRFISIKIGKGVFATEFIPKGTITWIQSDSDREFPLSELDSLPDQERDTILTYCYRKANGNLFLCGDNTRFINHSFDANCYLTPYGFEIAVKDILSGEELTNDYGFFNIFEPFKPHVPKTYQGSRSTVLPDDLLTNYELWDKKIYSAICQFPKVPQPLVCYLPDAINTLCHSIAEGKVKPASVKELSYF